MGNTKNTDYISQGLDVAGHVKSMFSEMTSYFCHHILWSSKAWCSKKTINYDNAQKGWKSMLSIPSFIFLSSKLVFSTLSQLSFMLFWQSPYAILISKYRRWGVIIDLRNIGQSIISEKWLWNPHKTLNSAYQKTASVPWQRVHVFSLRQLTLEQFPDFWSCHFLSHKLTPMSCR